MSFQSIAFPRKGWRSQRLLTKVCHSCLSRRTPVVSLLRRNTTSAPPTTLATETLTKPPRDTTITPVTQPNLLDSFRNELYHPTLSDPSLSRYSTPVQKAILRREGRKRLLREYRQLKAQPRLLAQITQRDMECLVNRFTTNPDDPASNDASHEAFTILKDLKHRVFAQAEFRTQDAEKMIYLATELDMTRYAEALLTEEVITKKHSIQPAAYEAVLRQLSKHKKQEKMDFWLDYIQRELGWTLSRDMVRSVVLCKVATGALEAAAHFLRRHHPGQDLAGLVTRYVMDDRELLDQALNVFAMDCMEQWRLNEMRQIYAKKRYFGWSTTAVIRNLLNKSLHTGQVHTAERMLSDTIYMQDGQGAQLCSKKLIQWYLSKKDVKDAVRVWEQMEKHNLTLSAQVLQPLLIGAAKLKYHVDAMRLYKRMKELYPKGIQADTHVIVFKCLVRSKQFDTAYPMASEIESLVPMLKPNVARAAVRALFSLSAQTGKLKLFERVFQQSEKLGLSVTHEGLTSLIACYLAGGDIQSAKSAFQSLASHTDGPDVVDFNLLMRAVIMEDREGGHDKILDILKHMKLVNVKPDQSTMRTMLGFYDSKSSNTMQNNLYTKLLDSTTRFDQVFLNNIALTNTLAETNVEHAAGILMRNNRNELFPGGQDQQPIECNGITFQILLDAATANPKYSSIAERLFKLMRARGMKPGRDVYENLVGVLAKKGKLAKARKYIVTMEQETGCKADLKTYTKLVDGLLGLDKPHLAKEVIMQDMVLNNIALDKDIRRKLKKIESKLSPSPPPPASPQTQ